MSITKFCGCYSQDQILDDIGVCVIHNTPYMYLCLNEQLQCINNPLMCPLCLQSHKGHKFESITNYFTPQFKHVLQTGTSANGPAVSRFYDHVMSDIKKMRGILNSSIDKLQATLKLQIQKLKIRYPQKSKFNIPGKQINKDNICILMGIYQRQKNRVWVPASQKYVRSLMGQVNTMIGNLLYDLQQHVHGKNWQKLTQYESNMMIQQFVRKYSVQYNPDRYYYKFSGQDKHYNIKVSQQGLRCQYMDSNPSQPGILTDNPFKRTKDTVYFKVLRMQKTMKIFDACVIFVGACVPHTAKIFGYRSLKQTAHGAYMIGSNGKSYHSNNTKYDKKSMAFGFDQGDVVAVQLDFDKKLIKFSKFGFFQRKFQMEIDCKNQDFQKLRPCVLFLGQKNAMVSLVDQNAYKHKDQDEDII